MEVWRDIKGYEGLYQVSNYGRVKSLEREYIHHLWKKPAIRKERISKLSHTNKNYLTVGLYKNGKRTFYKVHRLVAEAFIPNPENKSEVNHINGIKTDNYIENLEWVTSQENTIHAFENGLMTGRPTKEIEITKNNITLRFESGVRAAEYIGCKPQSIHEVANPKSSKKTIYGWSARYIEKEMI